MGKILLNKTQKSINDKRRKRLNWTTLKLRTSHQKIKTAKQGTPLAVSAANAGCAGSIPGRGVKIPHAMWCGQKIKNR